MDVGVESCLLQNPPGILLSPCSHGVVVVVTSLWMSSFLVEESQDQHKKLGLH